MIWGIGTGRCGTMSLAKEIDGVHEPKPALDNSGYAAIGLLKDRLAKGKPSIDWKQSFYIPEIKQIDPDAHFIWLIRNPFEFVSSFVARGGWDYPHYIKWTRGNLVERGLEWWLEVNAIISDNVPLGGPSEVRRTVDLELHENKGNKAVFFTPQEANYISLGTVSLDGGISDYVMWILGDG